MKKTIPLILAIALTITTLTGCSDVTQSSYSGLPLGKYSMVSCIIEGQELIKELRGYGFDPGDVYFALKESNEFSVNLAALFEDDELYRGRGKFEIEGNNLSFYYFDGDWDELVIDGNRVVLAISDDFILSFEKTYAEGHSPAELKEFERRLAELPPRDPGPSTEEFIELAGIATGLLLFPESTLLTDDSWVEFSDPFNEMAPRFRDAIYRKELVVFGKPMYVQISISDWAVLDVKFTDRDSPSADGMLALLPGVSDFFGEEPTSIYLNGDRVSIEDAKRAVASEKSGEDCMVSLYWTGVRLDGEPVNIMTSYSYYTSSDMLSYTISSDKTMADFQSDLDQLKVQSP